MESLLYDHQDWLGNRQDIKVKEGGGVLIDFSLTAVYQPQGNPKQENRGVNEKRFDEELNSLAEEKKFKVKEVRYLDIPYDEGVQTHIDAFRQLIGCIGDDDDLYACLTYGAKTMAITEFITLRYGEAIRSNTMVRCVVYGQKDWSSNTTKMYDVTALLQMAGIVEALAEAKVENAEEIIRRIIAL